MSRVLSGVWFQLWRWWRWEPAGALAMVALAFGLVSYADWTCRRRGVRALWRQWVIMAIVVTFAFDMASPFLDDWLLLPFWAPVPVLIAATLHHTLYQYHVPPSLRIAISTIVFALLQCMTPASIS